VAAALALGLVLLTSLVALGGPIVRLDRWVDDTLPRRHGGPAPLHAMAAVVSQVGNPAATVALLLAVAVLWAVWSRALWPVAAAAPAVVALTVTVLLGKWLLARPGPPGNDLEDSLGYFPSGHTATACVCAGTLAVLVARRHPRWRRGVTLAAAGWTVLVAWSMVWLHFHWLSDVLGGALLAALLLWLLYRWPWQLVPPPTRRSRDARPGAGSAAGTGLPESAASGPHPPGAG